MDSTKKGNSANDEVNSLKLLNQEKSQQYEEIFKKQQNQIDFLTEELERLKNPVS